MAMNNKNSQLKNGDGMHGSEHTFVATENKRTPNACRYKFTCKTKNKWEVNNIYKDLQNILKKK